MMEYDLIVIGSTPEAIYAAKLAISYKKRVALVTQPNNHSLETTRRILNPRAVAQIPLDKLELWTKEIVLSLEQENSFSSLKALGIDVVEGRGEFCRLPEQALIVNSRKLRGRYYLIATGCRLATPEVVGVQEVNQLRLEDLWQTDKLKSFKSLAIIGNTACAIQFAQSFQRLGKEVILAVETSEILPQQDPQASRFIQAQLESEGIQVMTESPLVQCKRLEDGNWIQVGNQALEVDGVLFAQAYELNLDGLNVEGVGIALKSGGIKLNSRGQTTNPQIYVCGQRAKGVENISKYEAKIAVKNSLIFPCFEANYHEISQTILTDPPLARVGLTQAQARTKHGDNISVVEDLFKTLPAAQVLGETTGFCQVVVGAKGEILGGHLVGPSAGELIGLIAIAMKQKVKFFEFQDFFPSAFSFSEIIPQTAVKWKAGLNESNNSLITLIKTWFQGRRPR